MRAARATHACRWRIGLALCLAHRAPDGWRRVISKDRKQILADAHAITLRSVAAQLLSRICRCTDGSGIVRSQYGDPL